MQQIIELPERLQGWCEATPENGIGYHILDVYYMGDRMITNQLVFNCKLLIFTGEQVVLATDIKRLQVPK